MCIGVRFRADDFGAAVGVRNDLSLVAPAAMDRDHA